MSNKRAKLYVVFYRVIGERCNGTYLVNGLNKRDARKIIKDADEDYVVDEVMTFADHLEDYQYDTVEDFLGGNIDRARFDEISATVGDFEQIECGT